ncbi:hypothetical protein RN001_007466 [Aquatica leii]|uniref:Uncharacterized protein n=1 Tax=Aquatica leii TaxID=1421715 RepID=A0AAN7Q4C4_9COLE|nr:hypothetical protein RN001_007466 [Aquatica leii]
MASTPPNRNTVKRKLSETVSSKSIKTRKRNTSNSSDSELSNIELYQDSSDNNSNFIGSPDSDNVDDVSEPFTLSQSKILVNDFVLVPMTDQKTGIEKTFVAQVTKIAMENETDVLYHVKFMRNYRQHLDIFVFPDIDDTSEIYKGDIAEQFKPDSRSWSLESVKFLGYYGSYEKARNIAAESDYTSTEEILGRGCRISKPTDAERQYNTSFASPVVNGFTTDEDEDELKFNKTVREVIQSKFPDIASTDFIREAGEWFRLGAQRYKRRSNKHTPAPEK